MTRNVDLERADYLVHGIRRGGNHAIINWVLSHFKSWTFHNDCQFEGGETTTEFNCFTKGDEPFCLTLVSFEDMPHKLGEISTTNPSATNIFILRDFYNTYASRFAKKWDGYHNTDAWKEIARIFAAGRENGRIKINYNRWFSDLGYRRSISANFGEFSDAGKERVPEFGGGSSFDEQRYDGAASKMDVLRRWTKFYRDDEYAAKILGDDEARDLNRQIFGFAPPRTML